MQTVHEILQSKAIRKTISVTPETLVFDALRVLAEHNIGALMVIDELHKVHGILSERDYTRKVMLFGKSSRDTTVREIMTPIDQMFRVGSQTTAEECMVLITGKHIRHLPVFDQEKFLGIISIGDILKTIISTQANLIEDLSNYIAGKYM